MLWTQNYGERRKKGKDNTSHDVSAQNWNHSPHVIPSSESCPVPVSPAAVRLPETAGENDKAFWKFQSQL